MNAAVRARNASSAGAPGPGAPETVTDAGVDPDAPQASVDPLHSPILAAVLTASADACALRAGRAGRLLAALYDPACDAARVVQAVRAEPEIARRILRIANSAYYGLSGRVASLDRAIVALGIDAVRGIAAAACLDAGGVDTDEDGATGSDLQLHSLAAALGAEEYARRTRVVAPGEAFVAGLLHDVGELAVQRARAPTVLPIDRTGLPDLGTWASDPRVHAAAGALVLQRWSLPAAIVSAAAAHHAVPEDLGNVAPLTRAVAVGDALARAVTGPDGARPPAGAPRPADLDEAAWDSLVTHVVTHAAQLHETYRP